MNYHSTRRVLTKLIGLTLVIMLSSVSLVNAATIAAPTNFEVKRVIATGLNLYWNYPDRTRISGYEIYRQSGDDSNWKLISTEGPMSVGFFDGNVNSGSSYTYKIRAFLNDWANNKPIYSDYAGPLSFQTPVGVYDPCAPNNLQSSLEGNTAVLTWTDNADNEDYFQIQRSTDGGAWGNEVVAPRMNDVFNTVTYRYPGLIPGTTNKFRVRAMRYSGYVSQYSNETTVTVSASVQAAGIPNAPSNLTASAYQKAIALRWQDNSDNEDSFTLSKREGNGDWKAFDPLMTGTTSYNDWDVVAGNSYAYKVQAVNHTGASLASNIVTFTAPDTTPKPTNPKNVTMQFYIENNTYYVNGAARTMEVAPTIYRSRTMLPIAYLADPLGAQISYDEASQKITVVLNNRTIELWIGSNSAKVNTETVSIDSNDPAVTPFILPPGRTMLPMSFIALNLGCTVTWDDATSCVQVSYFGS